ncbi:hypothetical protein LCGC14_2178120, partial [marine sediment metagenome]
MTGRLLLSIVTLALLCAAIAPAWGQAASPATLEVTHRAALGKLSKATWDNGVRWGQVAVTKEGHVLVFYCNDKRKIVYQLSTDGRSFAEPVQVASGQGPAVALDAEDNIYLIYKGARKRASFRKLPKTGPGKWDVSGKSVQPFVPFGEGPMNFPSLLILPGSKRIWCMYNYQKSDIFSLPRETWYPRRKPRGQAVVSYSDDGGKSWADPIYVGSDSGDEGSGIVVLRPWGDRATWFWTFWDCATPAWGRFDGSRIRPVREFFPHKRARMAVAHPWDTATGPDGKLYFATGMGSYTNGQVYKVFDGKAWSPVRAIDAAARVTLEITPSESFRVPGSTVTLGRSEVFLTAWGVPGVLHWNGKRWKRELPDAADAGTLSVCGDQVMLFTTGHVPKPPRRKRRQLVRRTAILCYR